MPSSQRPGSAFGRCRSASNLKPKTSSNVSVLRKECVMNTRVTTLAALVSSVLLWNVQEVAAQTNPPPATATRICLGDRKSTRLNSSHRCISYAVFCLKKKKKKKKYSHEKKNTTTK